MVEDIIELLSVGIFVLYSVACAAFNSYELIVG
jgi:hypothetical protein